MINFENTSVYGWKAAVRGMRNPLNSWDKSDSKFYVLQIGKNDLNLMKQLIKAGTDHSKFMRMITVTVDITAPLYWWKEFDTYKVGTVRNSCSTMHKIAAKEFTLDDFSHEHMMSNIGDAGVELVDSNGERTNVFVTPKSWLKVTISCLNAWREMYLETKDKKYWWQMIQLLPSSYNQRATVQLNYAVIRNMYHSRKNHKLDEWSQGFTKWIESLPYSELITEAHYADENKRMKEQIEQIIKKYE